MQGVKQFIIVATSYIVIICGTMYYSGIATTASIYDKFFISSEGIIIPTTDYKRAIEFYHNILDFDPIYSNSAHKSIDNIVGFKINRFLSLFLVQRTAAAGPTSPGSTFVIRVRNGFEKLHKILINRTYTKLEVKATESNYLDLDEKGTISSIIQKPWGKEFVASDFDGNKVIFVQPKLWSRSRF